MSEKTNEDEAQALGEALATDKSLETVREILFGHQVRETNQRSEELESLIKKSISAVEKEMAKQMNAIEKSIAKLSNDLDKRADKTATAIQREFDETRQTIAALEKATQTSQSDLADQLNADRDDLEKRAIQWNEDLANQLELIHQQLLHSKTDRASLSQLLHNMADAITDDQG